jgi:hypothetical protein
MNTRHAIFAALAISLVAACTSPFNRSEPAPVVERPGALFGDHWLPPAEIEMKAGRTYYVYPIAMTQKPGS